MLELPEVLNLSRQLDEELRGRTIASAGRGNSPHKFAFFKPSEEEMARTLAGRRSPPSGATASTSTST